MSCFESINVYSEEQEETKKDEILDKSVECLREEEEKATQDLHDFIDDFVNSQEYQDYINEKKKIVKRTIGCGYDPKDIIIETKKEEAIEKYPLTEEQKKMFAFKEHFEKYTEKQRIKKEIMKQERSIHMIKVKMHEAKRIFDCTWEFKQKEREKEEDNIMERYSLKFGIDTRILSPGAHSKLLDKFKRCHHALTARKKRREENICRIIEKLVFEYKIKKELIKDEHKRFMHKAKTKKEKIVEDLEIVGTKIQFIDREKLKKTPVVEPKKVLPKSVSKIKIVQKKPSSGEKEIKDQNKVEEKDIKNIDKKASKEKKEQPQNTFQLPTFPITNPRRKVLPENIDQIVDLVEEFRDFESEMENRDMYQVQRTYIDEDVGLDANPKIVLFQNFNAGRSYNKTVTISNVSCQIKKIRFLRFEFPNTYDEVVFEIESFGIKKLFTGCKVKFYVNFEPFDPLEKYEGKMVFLSYDVKLCQYYHTEIPIKCVPKYSDLKIYPELVNFGAIPLWRASKYDNSKIVKFINNGAKPCTIYIKKHLDPLDLGESFDEENKENIQPVSRNSVSTFQEICDILDDCITNIGNNFQFEHNYFTLEEREEKRIKVCFKHVSYVGHYLEKYIVDVYESSGYGELDIAGCQIISMRAETTGHFVTTDPEVLDFGTCLIRSCYQLSFEISNNSSYSQAISVRIPSHLCNSVQTDITMVYMPPKSQRAVFVKLSPRESATQNSCPYFDKNTSILEFPIQLYPVSSIAQDYPPVKVHVYAIIANYEDLTISFGATKNLSNFLNTILIDMGDCSIYESIWLEIFLTNNTLETQICAFVDLPEFFTLRPNYGFCKLYPGQRKKFKMYLSPDIEDFPSYEIGTLRHSHYFFKIRVETIFCLGRILRKLNLRIPKDTDSLDLEKKSKINRNTEMSIISGMMENMKGTLEQRPVTQSMINKEISVIHSLIPERILGSQSSSPEFPSEEILAKAARSDSTLDLGTVLDIQNFLIVETHSRKEVWCKVNLKRPLLEFSHQYVEFPDTACGSYSTMDISLLAHQREIDKHCRKKKAPMEYKAYFQIWGGSDEIKVEPTCGVLVAGQSAKITLVAKPNVPKEIVEGTAKTIKYSEIYEMKLKEYQLTVTAKKQNTKGKKEKNKETKNNKDENNEKETDTSDDKPDIIITDKELELDYKDWFPAEMMYWRCLRPYYINATFTCIIDYDHKKRDTLYLEATCKVVRPDFIVNLNIQRIDFETCLLGTSATKEIVLTNITYENINPKMSLLNPLGPFSTSYIQDLTLPPEHSLKLLIHFKPTSTKMVTEYIEITSNATILPLILCGEGSMPVINISPEFEVFRLDTKQTKLAELQLKIQNDSETRAKIDFKKLFEIEAVLTEVAKINKDEKKPKDKQNKVEKYSDSLTDLEMEAIRTCFNKTNGESHFGLKSPNDFIDIEPNTEQNVSILCGEPDLIMKKKVEGPKKSKKEIAVKKSDLSVKQATSKALIQLPTENKQYITQYNIQVGETYIKSIIIICTIKI